MNPETITLQQLNECIYTDIIKKGLSPITFLTTGSSPISHQLYCNNQLQLLEQLKNIYGLEIINCKDDDGNTILHYASRISHHCYQTIIKMGGDITLTNKNKVTPFHHIVLYDIPSNLPSTINELTIIELSALQDKHGITPLMISTIHQNNIMTIFIIDLIIKNNQEKTLFIQDNTNNNFLHHAYRVNNNEIISFFKKQYGTEPGLDNNIYNQLNDQSNIHSIKPYQYQSIIHQDDSNCMVENKSLNACIICKDITISPCTLPCSHKYCYSCLYDLSYTLPNFLCKYRCNINGFIPKLIEDSERSSFKFYLRRYYKLIKNLISLSEEKYNIQNDKLYFYKGGVELELSFNMSKLSINVKLLQYIPCNTELANSIFKALLIYNKPNGDLGVGSLYIFNNNIYSQIDIHLDYLAINSLLPLINKFIISIHTFSAYLAISTIEREEVTNNNRRTTSQEAILKINIEDRSYKKINLTTIIDNIGIWKPNSLTSNTLKLNNNIYLKISKDNESVELYKHIKSIDIHHIPTLKFIISYRSPYLIDNFRITLDTYNGLITVYSIVLINSCHLSILNQNITNFERAIESLSNKINVYCKVIE